MSAPQTPVPLHRQPNRSDRALMALSRVSQAILRVREDRSRLLSDVCSIIHEELAYELVVVSEWTSGGEIRLRACAGACTSEWLQPDAESAHPTVAHAHIRIVTRRVVEGREVVVEPVGGAQTEVGASAPWALAGIPVLTGDGVEWVMHVATPGHDAFGSEELGLLRELARDLGFAIETMEIEQRTRQAEQALRMSEERFRRLAEHSLVGIVMIQNDLYRYVNPAFAEMFGYTSPLDIIDKLGPVDLAAPESQGLVADNLRRRVLGQVRAVRYQYRGVRRDGTIFDVEEHGARTIHAQRLGVVATVLDVTAREASRRRLEALSRAALALSTARSPQQALDRAVEQLATILPCSGASIVLLEDLGPRLSAHVGSDHLARELAAALESGADGRNVAILSRIVESREAFVRSDLWEEDGGVLIAVPLVVRDEVIGVISVQTAHPNVFSDDDVQHLRLFADHLAATLQHLRLISSLEDERNRLQILNRLSQTLSETLSLQEVASRALRQIGEALHADHSFLYLWDQATESLRAAAAEGLTVCSQEALGVEWNDSRPDLDDWVQVWRDGLHGDDVAQRVRWDSLQADVEGVRSVLDVPLAARGELIGVLTFLSCLDHAFGDADADWVTALSVPVALAIQNTRFYERTARQAELMGDALHRQEELDRMKDELIQNISHELRTPLALVMGYAEMLDSGQLGSLSDEQSGAINVITRRSRMLRSLVEDIALLWHLERRVEAREFVDLPELIVTAVTEFESQARDRGLSLAGRIEPPELPATILGVPLQIRRVFDNLIGNSLKFTPAGGSIDVSLAIDNGWARISVSDTGVGVPQERLQRIFDRFYQVEGAPRRKYGGTGLGLALVKAIVDTHNGSIRAYSPITDDPEHPGTRVEVTLPLSDKPA